MVQGSEVIKYLVDKAFQYLVMLSIPLILCFYWPNHELRLMKFECMQYVVIVMFALCSIIEHKRKIIDYWLSLLLILAILNMFTHGMGGNTQLSMTFIWLPVIGFYAMLNKISRETVESMKKVIVVTCLINCSLFLTQLLTYYHLANIDMVFTLGQHGRPSGFMCYPVSFSLLCAVSFFFALEWKKWLCIPIAACLLLSQEYSVIIATIMAILFVRAFWLPLLLVAMAVVFMNHSLIASKMALRMQFWYPIFKDIWSRPLDGWGLGAFTALPHNFFGFDRGNWSELHCEPLDLFFSMGLIGLAWGIGFINGLRRYFSLNKYIQCLWIIAFASCFHSVFHFMDTCWLAVVVYVMYKIEITEMTP